MGGRIRTITLSIDTAGVAGSASGSAVSEHVEGFILDVDANYHASAPATTDLTVKQTGRTENIIANTDSATDARWSPRAAVHTAAGAAVTNGHDRYPVNGTITASLAQSDALTAACVVTIRILTL